jgi:hypothetical protein
MCLNNPVKVEMTGRDEGCERCAAPRAAAIPSAPPTTALQSESCGSKRRPARIPGRWHHAIGCNLAARRRNSTATELQSVSRNCTKLHQIAPNCGCAKNQFVTKAVVFAYPCWKGLLLYL